MTTRSRVANMSNTWHHAYSRWYDHNHAGHPIRATAWGWIADQIVRIGDRASRNESTR